MLLTERDGGVKNLEVKGELSVVINDEQASKAQIHIDQGKSDEYQFKTHPNMNKNSLSTNILALKDPSRSYPVGAPTGILKWRFTSKNESAIPLASKIFFKKQKNSVYF